MFFNAVCLLPFSRTTVPEAEDKVAEEKVEVRSTAHFYGCQLALHKLELSLCGQRKVTTAMPCSLSHAA